MDHSDFALSILASIANISIVVGWLYVPPNGNMSLPWRTLGIIIRLSIFHAVGYWGLSIHFGLSLPTTLNLTTGLLFASLVCATIGHKVDGMLAELFAEPTPIYLLAAIAGPLYVCGCVMLGLPVLPPNLPEQEPEREELPVELRSARQKIATVLVALRPHGLIELNGEKYPAISADGSLIDAGAKVVVDDIKGSTISVLPQSSSNPESKASDVES